ncbi:MAG TPA: hypothetical protein VNI78_07615 [Vicinamibacterales bacterium]|nr:hypothetical protein [Vicinamibacterales bacterium]
MSQPFVGASTGSAFGSAIRAGFGLTFGDLLRDRRLEAAFRVGTDLDDFAAQITYINRKSRWNWGVTAGAAAHWWRYRRCVVSRVARSPSRSSDWCAATICELCRRGMRMDGEQLLPRWISCGAGAWHSSTSSCARRFPAS